VVVVVASLRFYLEAQSRQVQAIGDVRRTKSFHHHDPQFTYGWLPTVHCLRERSSRKFLASLLFFYRRAFLRWAKDAALVADWSSPGLRTQNVAALCCFLSSYCGVSLSTACDLVSLQTLVALLRRRTWLTRV